MAAGDLDWDGITVDWDGESVFTLHVPHQLGSWTARRLARRLPMKLRGLLGTTHVQVNVTDPPSEDNDDWGDLSIGPLTPPFRAGETAADKLREIIEEACDAAEAEADEAFKRSEVLRKSLRRRG